MPDVIVGITNGGCCIGLILAGVCVNNLKARGVTGRPNPVGDPFDVDYVAHEMGHQFGADHSFNKCSGTENSATAYEPGSGSTIMGYAGICGAVNNIQSNTDDYFHKISLSEINNYFVNEHTATCAVITAGQASPDVVVSGESYSIPLNTPFELPMATTTPVDSDNEVLINTEQYNRGNYQIDEDQAGTFTAGPAFRSVRPDTVSSRTFPRVSILRGGLLATRGERLSTVARNYSFSYTGREVFSDGWGSLNSATGLTSIQVVGTPTNFVVTFPNVNGDELQKNTTNTITWDVAESDIAPINCSTVDILMSTDGGATFPLVLAEDVPNNGSADVMIPDLNTTTARIKVKSNNNIFFSFSRNNIRIVDSVVLSIPKLDENNAVSVYPNPTNDFLNIELKDAAQAGNVMLINAVGQTIWSSKISAQSNRIGLNTQPFAKGVYILQFKNEKGAIFSKKVSIL